MYPYGLIGNCSAAALVRDDASMDWLCLPRPDSEPVFGRLLDAEGGHFSIAPPGPFKSRQDYLPNTNLLRTVIELKDGSAYSVTDFCPRFAQYGRVYRPLTVIRIVEPLRGNPFVRLELRPVQGWSQRPMAQTRGNSHLRFQRGADYLRVASNVSLTYLCGEIPFGLKEPAYFALTWNAPLEDDLAAVCRDFERKTRVYWENWVRHCDVPTRHQGETIRSALALKLHCYEDTGAILAALTTSLPETPDGVRNWDYRYCWLRDAYFCLAAFHRLGHFEEMEGFLSFLLDLAHREEGRLRPVYALDQTLPLPELQHGLWSGWQGGQPVRSGNQAAEHVQNDVYGEMLMTLTPLFLDERFASLRHPSHERLMAQLAGRVEETLGQADAGLWELRDAWKPHAFTHLIHWAGLERLARLKARGKLPGLTFDPRPAQDRALALLRRCERDSVLLSSPEGGTLDASLLLAPVLGLPDPALCAGTVGAIRAGLRCGEEEGFLYRYRSKDDFGKPDAAFMICSFWLIQALVRQGRLREARAAMARALEAANPLGLLAEHYDPGLGVQLGNFPQAYSHVGLINAAFAVSEPWDEVL